MIEIRELFTLYRLYFYRNVNRLCNYVFVYQNIVYISYMVPTNLVINYLALPLILILHIILNSSSNCIFQAPDIPLNLNMVVIDNFENNEVSNRNSTKYVIRKFMHIEYKD